jgi:hypothetical protein
LPASASAGRASSDGNVFLNVPFDRSYKKLFDALVYTIAACGLQPRCALEADDGATARLHKIYDLIEVSDFGIHDLSRTGLDPVNRLPRFNMPLELGIFLGAKRFGGSTQGGKICLILGRDSYGYQKYCSDIAGQDIRAHRNDVAEAIRAVRNWLQPNLPGAALPGPQQIAAGYVRFRQELPALCERTGLHHRDLTFLDYRTLVQSWIALADVEG